MEHKIDPCINNNNNLSAVNIAKYRHIRTTEFKFYIIILFINIYFTNEKTKKAEGAWNYIFYIIILIIGGNM